MKKKSLFWNSEQILLSLLSNGRYNFFSLIAYGNVQSRTQSNETCCTNVSPHNCVNVI
jgi:hypothetical protein